MARKARFGKFVLNTVLVGLAVAGGIAVGRGPWLMWQEQRKRGEVQVGQMRQSERTREDLLRQEARLRSSVGKEEEARANGWLMPGEKRVDPVQAPAPEAGASKPPLSGAAASGI